MGFGLCGGQSGIQTFLSEYLGLSLSLSFHQCSMLGLPYHFHSINAPYLSPLIYYIYIFWILTGLNNILKKVRRKIWVFDFKNNVYKSEGSMTINTVLPTVFFFTITLTLQRIRGGLPSFFPPSYVSRKTRIDCFVKTLLTGFAHPTFLCVSWRLTILPWEYFK